MGTRAEEMIQAALDSFANRDVERRGVARATWTSSSTRANRRVVRPDPLQLGADPDLREWGLRMLLVSRCLERIGDHAVDIGEQTAYLVSGRVPRVHRRLALASRWPAAAFAGQSPASPTA